MFDKDLLLAIGNHFKKGGVSISIAESVTSGLLQCAFSNIPDASTFYQGGITAYNVGQKARHLLVDPVHALSCDSVSDKLAQDLARNVCNLFTSNYGIGIVGYAARMPEKQINSLYAYYAISFEGEILKSGKLTTDVEEGFPAQKFYTDSTLQNLLSVLESKK